MGALEDDARELGQNQDLDPGSTAYREDEKGGYLGLSNIIRLSY